MINDDVGTFILKYEAIAEMWKRKRKQDIPMEVLLNGKIIPLAYHSGRIENEAIRFNDTRDIFEHDCISNYTGDLRTIFEIRNSKDAIQAMLKALEKNTPLDSALICSLQYELTKNTYDNARWNNGERPGFFKLHDYVTGRNEVGALAEDVPVELGELLDEISEFNGTQVLRASAYLHAKFENIHPFADGNGRTGRLIMNYFLLSKNHPPVIIHEDARATYFAALEAWDSRQELSPMEDFLKKEVVRTWENTLAREQNLHKPIGNQGKKRNEWEQNFWEEKMQKAENIENPSIRQDYLNYLDAAIKSISQIPTQQSKEDAFIDYMKKRLLEYHSDKEVAKALGTPHANDLENPKP